MDHIILPAQTQSSLLLPELFARAVQQFADRPAITFGDQTITYGQLDEKANILSCALRAEGVGRGSFVGLWMARSLDLHIALLAILKAGAAYIPFDYDTPSERVATCLSDAGADFLLLDSNAAAKSGKQSVRLLINADLLRGEKETSSIDLRAEGGKETDPAYVIYTSGSTGQPKGVVINHRNICSFLHSAQSVYQLVPADVVFQGASIAFDLSLEEIFVPYLAGAHLWVASQDILRDTENLGNVMVKAGITVLDTVPTLLSLLSPDIPGLRLIITGGETISQGQVGRWYRPGLRIFNTYGPTETTVVATAVEVRPEQPVTIGRPIPGYSCYVVDDEMNLLAVGQEGELLIGGHGVAVGYLNRPELTAQKFITNPFARDEAAPFLYRTGDLVSWNEDGCLFFHGRIDDQVKIRGFRVELGEIEERLNKINGITQSAVVLRNVDNVETLVAFVVLSSPEALDVTQLREILRPQLPPYMLPSLFQPVPSLPRLVSGKIDRKNLTREASALTPDCQFQDQPQTGTEAILLAAAGKVFRGQPVNLDADFFLDLGGHSLIAAQFVSILRKNTGTGFLTLQDMYNLRSLRSMATAIDQRQRDKATHINEFAAPPLLRRFLCGLAQAAVLPVILAMTTAPWLGVFVSYQLFSGEDYNFFRESGTLVITYGLLNLLISLISIIGKWLVIGRTKPGNYPLWGVYYFRWWLSRKFVNMIHWSWLRGSPMIRIALRMLGAKIGHEAFIGDMNSGAVDLVTVGEGACLGSRVIFANAEIIGDRLLIGRVDVGSDALIGSSCVLGRDVSVGDGAELADLTSLGKDTRVGAGEKWEGAPGYKTEMVNEAELPRKSSAGFSLKIVQLVVYATSLVMLPPVTLIPIIPAFYVLDRLFDTISRTLPLDWFYYSIFPLLCWPAAMLLIFITVFLIAAIRWIVLPRVEAGTSSVYSWFYLRKWVVCLATELTLETLSSLYATVYMRNWFRLMGLHIGKDSEISANPGSSFDLIEIGDKCFIADEVVIGDDDVRRGWMTLKPTRLAQHVFVGNSAILPSGTDIPTGTLIGIKSVPPGDNDRMKENSVWFGSPAIEFPVRQKFDDIAVKRTYSPSWRRRIGRAIYEAFSVSFPSVIAIAFGSMAVEALTPYILARDIPKLIGYFVVASVGISFALCFSAIGLKWLMMGKYRPISKPMWSWWALRTESVAVTYWGAAGNALLEHLRGTPFLPWMFRLFGCKFGQGVYVDCCDITEFDCVEVGDFAVLNNNATLQTHLYEDRVMKIGRVKIGRGVSIASGSTVLYDTKIGDYSRLGPLTIIMKGEEIPPNSHWHGTPAEPVGG